MKKSLRESLKTESAESKNANRDEFNSRADVNTLINEYSGMSENELMQELISATARQKAEGRFDGESLKKGVNAILPMLNDQQKKKLYEIIGRL
ncbi:MAG: hypothetical protein K6G56_00495 [Clostridiales bacterium]|nr:hypothetical protein [Clostridiales bacterium]